MSERGVIQHRTRAEQKCEFSGMRFANGITPTDLDVFIDFGNKAFVFIEAKYDAAQMPRGQELAHERLCDACERGGVPSLYLVVSHTTPVFQLIDVSKCDVVRYRYKGTWLTPRTTITAREAVDKFLRIRKKAA